MFRRNFLFGKDGGTANLIDVGSEDLYQPGKGYGFVTEKNRREQKLLQIRELNSSFDTMYWYQNEQLSFLKEDENGCYLDSAEEVAALERQSGEPMSGSPRRIPLIFKVDVPRQGNYRITLTIRSEEEMGEILIFTGRRRLAFHGTVGAVLADRPRIGALTVEEVNGPTVYLAGDSTVTDQPGDYPYYPGTCYCGWGQMLPAYFDTRVAVSNHSHSGLTTDSFRKEGHYAVISQYSKPGDYVFFQFGHNDQKLPGLQAKGGYRANLHTHCKKYLETAGSDLSGSAGGIRGCMSGTGSTVRNSGAGSSCPQQEICVGKGLTGCQTHLFPRGLYPYQ